MIEKTDFVCINVASNEGRRNHMKELAEQRGIPLRFFSAITPQTLATVPSRYSRRRAQFWWGRELMPTEQACGLSHIKIWRDFAVSDYEYLVVFEDDLAIEADFMDVVKAVLRLPVVPDFTKFSGQHERPSKPVCKLGVAGYELRNNAVGPIDAACYMLSKKGAAGLEKYCELMHLAVDVLMDRTFSHKVPCYTVRPYPADPIVAETGVLATDIGERNKYDANRFVRLMTRLLRAYSSVRKRIWRMSWSKSPDPVRDAVPGQ